MINKYSKAYRPRRRRWLVLVFFIVAVGVLIYLIGNALAIDTNTNINNFGWRLSETIDYGPIDISLLRTDFDDAAMVYRFYYENRPLDISRHHIVDPDDLVQFVAFNPQYNQISIFTHVPVMFHVEHNSSTDNVYLFATNPRYIYDKIVVIDPGHGGADTGAIVGNVRESDLVLEISLRIYELFQQSDSGIKVYMTRHDDSTVLNSMRSHMANTIGDLLVSVHTNAYENSQSAAGTEVLFHPVGLMSAFGNTGRINISNARFAQIVQDDLIAELGTRDRGILERRDLLLLNTATVPTAYIEIDFKTNPAALANLTDPNYQQRVAQTVYNSIVYVFSSEEFIFED